MSAERGSSPLATGYRIARDVVGQMHVEDLDLLLAPDAISLEEGPGDAPEPAQEPGRPQAEDTSPDMLGFDDERGASADADGDFADDEGAEPSPFDNSPGDGPGALRRRRTDVTFEPSRHRDGSVAFEVRVSPATASERQGSSLNEVVADLARLRTEETARLAEFLASEQRRFLEALLIGAPYEEAELFLESVTQDRAGKATGLTKDAVARLAHAAYAEIGGPVARTFPLGKLMGRSRTLGVHPDALKAHASRLAPGVRGPAELLEALCEQGVISRPKDPAGLKSLREHLRQVCAAEGISFAGSNRKKATR